MVKLFPIAMVVAAVALVAVVFFQMIELKAFGVF